jgi:hypothetical protein
MLDLNVIRRRAASRANTATPANAANWLTPRIAPISQLATLATLAKKFVTLNHPYRLTKAEGDAAHAEPWDDAVCGRFVARVALFMRRGINATDADDLAERLHLRDVQGDDRGMCLECERLDMRGRCQAAAAGEVLGVDRRLEPVPTVLLRCEAFEPSKELA